MIRKEDLNASKDAVSSARQDIKSNCPQGTNRIEAVDLHRKEISGLMKELLNDTKEFGNFIVPIGSPKKSDSYILLFVRPRVAPDGIARYVLLTRDGFREATTEPADGEQHVADPETLDEITKTLGRGQTLKNASIEFRCMGNSVQPDYGELHAEQGGSWYTYDVSPVSDVRILTAVYQNSVQFSMDALLAQSRDAQTDQVLIHKVKALRASLKQ